MSKFAQMETQAERNQDGSGAQELSDDDDNEDAEDETGQEAAIRAFQEAEGYDAKSFSAWESHQVIPTPSHVLDHISPIFPPLFLVFCAFSPPGRDGSNVVARAGVETQSKLQVCTTEKKASCTDLHMSVTLSPPPPPPLPPPPPPSRRQRQAAGKSE